MSWKKEIEQKKTGKKCITSNFHQFCDAQFRTERSIKPEFLQQEHCCTTLDVHGVVGIFAHFPTSLSFSFEYKHNQMRDSYKQMTVSVHDHFSIIPNSLICVNLFTFIRMYYKQHHTRITSPILVSTWK